MSAKLSDRLVFARFFYGENAFIIRQLWDKGYVHSNSRPNPFDFPGDAEWYLIRRLLYFVGDDPERIERLYRRSALSRSKGFGMSAELQGTIERAIEGHDDRYLPDPEDFEIKDNVGEGPLADIVHRLRVDAPDYQHAFELGRHLKSHPEKDEIEATREYAGLIGRDFEEFYTEAVTVFQAVQYGEDESRWTEAVKRAETEMYPAEFPGVPSYTRFASIFYHLAQLNGGLFWMNLTELRGLFSKSDRTYYYWRDRMVDDGLCVCVDEKYDHRKGKAQVFKWTAPSLEELTAAVL